MRFPIRAKLILAICVPLLPLYLTVLAVDYQADREQTLDQMRRHLTEATAHIASEIDRELAVVHQTAINTAAVMTQGSLKAEEQFDMLLGSNVRDTPVAYGSAIAFEPYAFQPDCERFARYVYRPAASNALKTTGISYDYSRWDWYLLPKLLRQPAWTDPYFDEGAGNILMCTCSAPFYHEQQFLGVVTVDISLDYLHEKLRQVDTSGGYCVIVSRTGTFVSHPIESYVLGESVFSLAEWFQSPELAEVGHEMIAGKSGVRRLIDVETGVPTWVVFVPVSSVGWSVAAVISEAQVMADVYGEVNRRAAFLLGGLAAIVLLIMFVAAWITRPIARLATAAQELAKGNLEVQVPASWGHDEIREFADTFNTMVRDLKGNIEERIRATAARESLERELQVARQIQASLLPMTRPPFPEHTQFALDALNEPAKIMTGDFFDFWFVEENVLALVVADVCGKGVPAAMFMAIARTILRNFPAVEHSPAEALTLTNRILAGDNEEQMFVTVFFAHYHVDTGVLEFTNAGHNPPYLVRRDGSIAPLGSTGPFLGVWEDAEFENGQASLGIGDLLVAYTDGVTEAADEQAVLLGEERLMKLLAAIHTQTVEEICRRILQEVNEYRVSKDQDDVTLLALKRFE